MFKNYDSKINELRSEVRELRSEVRELKDKIFNLTSNAAYVEMLQKYEIRERKNFEKAKKIIKLEESPEIKHYCGFHEIIFRHLKLCKGVSLERGEFIYKAYLGNFAFSKDKAEKLYNLYELLR